MVGWKKSGVNLQDHIATLQTRDCSKIPGKFIIYHMPMQFLWTQLSELRCIHLIFIPLFSRWYHRFPWWGDSDNGQIPWMNVVLWSLATRFRRCGWGGLGWNEMLGKLWKYWVPSRHILQLTAKPKTVRNRLLLRSQCTMHKIGTRIEPCFDQFPKRHVVVGFSFVTFFTISVI